MQIISPTYFLFVFIEVYSGALRAQGHVIVTTAMTMIGICVLRVVWVTWIVPDGTLSQIVAWLPNYMAGQRGGMIIYYHYKQKKDSGKNLLQHMIYKQRNWKQFFYSYMVKNKFRKRGYK